MKAFVIFLTSPPPACPLPSFPICVLSAFSPWGYWSSSQCPGLLLSSLFEKQYWRVCLFSGVHFWVYRKKAVERWSKLRFGSCSPGLKWSPGIQRRTTYPTDDGWELVVRRRARCAEPMEKSSSVAKEFCCSLAAFRQVTTRRIWKPYPVRPGSQACRQNALLF